MGVGLGFRDGRWLGQGSHEGPCTPFELGVIELKSSPQCKDGRPQPVGLVAQKINPFPSLELGKIQHEPDFNVVRKRCGNNMPDVMHSPPLSILEAEVCIRDPFDAPLIGDPIQRLTVGLNEDALAPIEPIFPIRRSDQQFGLGTQNGIMLGSKSVGSFAPLVLK